ncbi:hypothetical protein [Hydrogenimonas sp.]
MCNIEIKSNDALKIAVDILEAEIKRPVLALIPEKIWRYLKNRDRTDTIGGSGSIPKLSTLKNKSVVFCHYMPDEEDAIKALPALWQEFLNGGVVYVRKEKE